jgi:hypothetical protein
MSNLDNEALRALLPLLLEFCTHPTRANADTLKVAVDRMADKTSTGLTWKESKSEQCWSAKANGWPVCRVYYNASDPLPWEVCYEKDIVFSRFPEFADAKAFVEEKVRDFV